MKSKQGLLLDHYSKEWQEQFLSPVPKHLSEAERARWEKEVEYAKQEVERRRREGFWKYDG